MLFQLNHSGDREGCHHGLSHGVYACLHAHGTPEQQALYLPKLVSGEWTGTMCLTESHCGTDLDMLRSKAESQSDGSYSITGSKIFISAGEHDLSQNITHLCWRACLAHRKVPRVSRCSWCGTVPAERRRHAGCA